jgi:cell shape-determining protein MreD
VGEKQKPRGAVDLLRRSFTEHPVASAAIFAAELVAFLIAVSLVFDQSIWRSLVKAAVLVAVSLLLWPFIFRLQKRLRRRTRD